MPLNFTIFTENKNTMYLLYFDPGLGAMIIQALVAIVAGVVLFSKNLLYKIKLFFGLVKEDNNNFFDDINVNDSDTENNKKSDSE
jgi:hypothetical protein|uniref:hypothetical protein n=2 Tax=Gelidibacter sp. TaxID=2018083 RepID=UPI004049BB64